MADLPAGLYESLLSKNLQDLLDSRPELRSVFAKLESDEEPTRYAAFVAKLVEKALRLETDPEIRLQLCNAIIERTASAFRRCPKHRGKRQGCELSPGRELGKQY